MSVSKGMHTENAYAYPCLQTRVVSPVIDLFCVAAIKMNVSELVIKVQWADPRDSWYSIPPELVIYDSLRVLDLDGCTFGDRISCIDLPHLQKLKLYTCRFASENVLPKILCGCPEMEFLQVSSCEGVGSFLSIPCRSRLKYFRIGCYDELERLEILAPGLETFYCSVKRGCSVDLIGCTALKHLELHSASLSAEYVHRLKSKLLCIEELKLLLCRGIDKFQISSSCLKRLIVDDCGGFCGGEIETPNLLSLQYRSLDKCRSKYWFSSWNAPRVEEVHMVFFYKNFQSACRGGLKGFLMKLQNYEGLKLVIGWIHNFGGGTGADFIMHEKLNAVSFSSLNKFVKRANPTYVLISSRSDDSLFHMLDICSGSKHLSLISSSRCSIERLHKKLSNSQEIMYWHSEVRLVSIEEIENEMDTACKSFEKTYSNGYHTAGIVLVERSF
ncbi:unnamed protein product [Cuscuta campestris]|uniref:At1g61320/AtMIF1 LRR domain-containing protein n=1 Tax=Cuscuta campestris TaxID=132261 RepID=A0A484K5M8_9ASTE|nr:unnamed protein product [Cuscuta campestris]